MRSISLLSTLRISLLLLLFAVPAWGQTSPAWVDSGGLAAEYSASNSDLDVTYPTIAADHILLLAAFSADDSSITHNTPAGWTLVSHLTNSESGSFEGKASLWWKRAAGGETGALTITRTADSQVFAGIMWAFDDCLTTDTPFEDMTSLDPVNSDSCYTATVTSTVANTTILSVVVEGDNNPWGLMGHESIPQVYWDERFELATSLGSDCSFFVNSDDWATAAERDSAWAKKTNIGEWYSWTMVLLPEPAAGGARRSNVSQ